jgi:hypothetical protein
MNADWMRAGVLIGVGHSLLESNRVRSELPSLLNDPRIDPALLDDATSDRGRGTGRHRRLILDVTPCVRESRCDPFELPKRQKKAFPYMTSPRADLKAQLRAKQCDTT